MWSTGILFCLYLQSVTVCCDISAGLIRTTDLYGTCYVGLFFEMLVSTSVIPVRQCSITLYSMQAVFLQNVSWGNVTIQWGNIIGNCKYTRVLHRTVSEQVLFHCTGVWVWGPKLSFTHAILRQFRFLFMGLDEGWSVQNKSGYRDKLLVLIMYIMASIK